MSPPLSPKGAVLPLHIYFRSPFRWVITEGFHEFRPQFGQIPPQGAGFDAQLLRRLLPRVAHQAQLYGGAQARRQARHEPLAVDVSLHLRGDVYAGDAFGQRLQREAGVALGASVGVAGEGAQFLGAPAQGVGGVGVLPRVAVVVVVEGD